VPPKILNKLYERGSLRNTETGFELAFKNSVAPSTLIEIGPLVVDGNTYEARDITLRLERPSEILGRQPSVREWQATVVKSERVLSFDLYTVARVLVQSDPLPPGQHQVALEIKTKEVGEITLTAEDSVAE
jgi:hydroxymethylglutaryl-CoA reductase (NADPH)